MKEPNTTSEVLLDAEDIRRCKHWLATASGACRVLVIESPHTGMGVSTLLRLACHEEGIEPIYVSTNMPKLKTLLRDASGSPITVDGLKKIFVIDPVDAVLAEPTCAMEIADFFKAKSPIPAVFAGIRLRSSIAKLNDMVPPKLYEVTTIALKEIDTTRALAYLEDIKQREQKKVDVTTLWTGDVRNALAALETDVPGSIKDDHCDGTNAVSRVLFDPTLTIRDSIHMHEGDVSMIIAGTHENYPHTGQSVDTCAKLAEAYSISDCMEEHMYATQRWELADVTTAISAGAPIAYLDKHASQKHRTIDLSKFGTIWSRNNNQRTKEKSLRGIRHTMIEHGIRNGHHIESLAAMRAMIMHAVKLDRDWETIIAMVSDLPNETILAIMRLWKCGYTQAHHGYVKKRRLV